MKKRDLENGCKLPGHDSVTNLLNHSTENFTKTEEKNSILSMSHDSLDIDRSGVKKFGHRRCNIENCGKVFYTCQGLNRHRTNTHGLGVGVEELACPVCGKRCLYLHQHMKAFHKENVSYGVREVCRKKVGNMKNHRGFACLLPGKDD